MSNANGNPTNEPKLLHARIGELRRERAALMKAAVALHDHLDADDDGGGYRTDRMETKILNLRRVIEAVRRQP